MKRPAWLTRGALAWGSYDVASSTYMALVPAFYGLYFVQWVARGQAGADAVWGGVAALSVLLAAVLGPLAGAMADRAGRDVRVLGVLTTVCVGATLLLPLASARGPLAAALGFLVAQLAYTLAISVYDARLVHVAAREDLGAVSGLGWSLGLIGGIGAIFVALALLHGLGKTEQLAAMPQVFAAAGVLFGLLAVPALRLLAQEGPQVPRGTPAEAASPWRSVLTTIRHWRRHREALRVLLAFFLVNDVVVTIQFFIAIVLSARFGLSVAGLLWLGLLFHAIALPSTVACGVLADRWGQRRALVLMSGVLALAILLLAFGHGTWVPAVAAVLLGLIFGALQAVFRSLYASLVPPRQAAELFGFNAVAGRLSAAIGPLIFGAASSMLGGPTWALCLLLVPLAAGALLLALSQPGSAQPEAA
ncbi:MAG TPA: MFS transporter [Burkholderiaceae bacterium]|nr:MFS transporter [Burkholderiaceae bacterium]